MYSLRGNEEFCFNKEEEKKIEQIASEIISNLKRNNLTYAQAVEVLEICKVKLKMCLLG
ncbi:hypothetical protein G9F73_012730 [Clostridium estertheticum]|uniref:hypothetical protein n=1 Tax=Clostridium estertheticum TaxID=238834 RepID=UPI0013EEAFCD|nr:hypothetical protein [Clostridium estertheticum]MBZ9608674.1 hypothetical protein [Clostridium estertheticum]